MAIVTVFHNIAGDEHGRTIAMLDGYQHGHPLVPVLQDLVGLGTPTEGGVSELLEHYYHLLNVGDDPAFGGPHPLAVIYRQQGNRSLSVGDVIAIENGAVVSWFAVASFGFDPLAEPPAFYARFAKQHGTTPLDRDVEVPRPALDILKRSKA